MTVSLYRYLWQVTKVLRKVFPSIQQNGIRRTLELCYKKVQFREGGVPGMLLTLDIITGWCSHFPPAVHASRRLSSIPPLPAMESTLYMCINAGKLLSAWSDIVITQFESFARFHFPTSWEFSRLLL